MEKQELLKKIEMVIKKQTLSKEVKEAVNKTYIEYQDAYRALLSNIERAIGNEQKYLTELNHIVDYMKYDCEEDREMSIEMGNASYAIKIDAMLENVINGMNTILSREEREKSYPKLEAIIDTEELTEEEKARRDEQEKEESIRKSVTTTVSNVYCAKEIVGSIISEVGSSKDSLMRKVSTSMKNAPNIDYIKFSQEEFKKEIETIVKEAKEKLTVQIKEALDAQDSSIANEIIAIYNQYKETSKELTQREKFSATLQAKVNPEEAIRKIQETTQEKETTRGLSGNIIE